MSEKKGPPASLGPIRPDELYPFRVLQSRLGWGTAALKTARDDGLRVGRYKNLHYVMGSELIRFLQSQQSGQ